MAPGTKYGEPVMGMHSVTGYVNIQEPPSSVDHPVDVSVSIPREVPQQVKVSAASNNTESLIFEESESLTWKSHNLKRYSDDDAKHCTAGRLTVVYRWVLVVILGVFVALIGLGVKYGTNGLSKWKFATLKRQTYEEGNFGVAYICFLLITLLYSGVSGSLCVFEPNAVGSGIPQIKAYLNGINLHKVVQVKTLFVKVIGMMFSVASGLPVGKEGPMIHAGSIVGAVLSQGTPSCFGFKASWTKYQDLRNDRSKRDYVTFGAAAGVAAAFSAPIGGILFVLEEGASFWSPSLTFRGFFCAMMCELTVSLITRIRGNQAFLGRDPPVSMFDFGSFTTFNGYYTYELFIFILLGCLGGMVGAGFNQCVCTLAAKRKVSPYLNNWKKRMLELFAMTGLFATLCFVLPLFSDAFCRPIPFTSEASTNEELKLVEELVPFNCGIGRYNELASLFLVDADVTLQMLFHLESGIAAQHVFGLGALFTFLIVYFFCAVVSAGLFCPAGLFVPTLVSGAALGRIVGVLLSGCFPGWISDAGLYSLLGAAAVLGGMSRMTIAGTVIILEATHQNEFLLPLMLVFAGARYTGNVFTKPMYDMAIDLAGLPFLDSTMQHHIKLLNYHPVSNVMSSPVRSLYEMNKVGAVYELLKETTHNGFPVIARNGQLRGFIMRNTLCCILQLKAFATPVVDPDTRTKAPATSPSMTSTSQIATDYKDAGDVPYNHRINMNSHNVLYFETVERNTYPDYPAVETLDLTAEDKEAWLDVRIYMDRAPHILHESSSILRAYRYFRTMGLRHLLITDNAHRVTGMITRANLTEKALKGYWTAHLAKADEFIHAELPHDDHEEFYYVDDDVSDIPLPQQEQSLAAAGANSSQTIRVVNQIFPVKELEDLRGWRVGSLHQSAFHTSAGRSAYYTGRGLKSTSGDSPYLGPSSEGADTLSTPNEN